LRRFLLFFVLVAWSVQTVCAQVSESPVFLESTFREGNGIFAPQQTITLDVTFGVTLQTVTPSFHEMTLHAVLVDLSQPERPIAHTHLPISNNGERQITMPISLVTPEKQGVYGITLTVSRAVVVTQRQFPNIPRLTEPAHVHTAQTIADSQLQFVVVSPQVSPRSAGNLTLVDTRDLLATEDSPARRQLLNLPRMPDLPRIRDLPIIGALPSPALPSPALPQPCPVLPCPNPALS